MCSWGLNELGDIANIVIAIASVATAIVTARMLVKQHKLQQEQHELDRVKHELEEKKFIAQKQEHQPIFYFKRCSDRLEVCNSGEKLAQPITIAITSNIFVRVSIFNGMGVVDYDTYVPINIYRESRCQEELDGVVVKCFFSKDDREKLHTICTTVANKLMRGSKIPLLAGVIVRESDLISIEYTDVYKQKHQLFYVDSMLTSSEVMMKIGATIQMCSYKPHNIHELSADKIVEEVLRFKYIKNW